MYRSFQIKNLEFGGGTPRICVPLAAGSIPDAMAQMKLIREAPCDLVEWRADYLEGGCDPQRALEALNVIREGLGDKVLLFTFRTRQEGGEAEITPERYEELCLAAASSRMADLVDVEYHLGRRFMAALTEKLQETGAGVIGSCHDFRGTPAREEIVRTMCDMQSLGVNMTKMAVMPSDRRDVLELLEASVMMEEKLADRPFITMSMGKLGAVSRLAGSLTGSAVTFASAGRASAPGQMSAAGVRAALDLLC